MISKAGGGQQQRRRREEKREGEVHHQGEGTLPIVTGDFSTIPRVDGVDLEGSSRLG